MVTVSMASSGNKRLTIALYRSLLRWSESSRGVPFQLRYSPVHVAKRGTEEGTKDKGCPRELVAEAHTHKWTATNKQTCCRYTDVQRCAPSVVQGASPLQRSFEDAQAVRDLTCLAFRQNKELQASTNRRVNSTCSNHRHIKW